MSLRYIDQLEYNEPQNEHAPKYCKNIENESSM